VCLGKVTALRLVRAAAFLSLIVGSAALLAAAPASAETRSLKIYQVHTGEKAIITYKKNGRYLPDGLKKLNYMLRDWRRNEPTKMDPHVLDLLWKVYQRSGSRDYVHVISGYRAPATNAMLRSRSRGVAKHSQHMLGKAIDFYLPDVPLKKLRYIGLKIEAGGVGYYPRSGSPFVHMDVATPRYWPRMSRRELMALFPNGKTMYVPSDGKPLPGYRQAVAAYQARKAGGSAVQIASASAGKKRSLLGVLFGGDDGGVEAAEDNADNGVVAPQDTAPAVAVADASSALPRIAPVVPTLRPAPVAQNDTTDTPSALAAMSAPPGPPSAPSVPSVPRPQADLVQVASIAPSEGASAPSRPTDAFAVPLPGQRPDGQASSGDPATVRESSPTVMAALVPQERPDRMAVFVGRALAGEMDETSRTTASNAPLPPQKPLSVVGQNGRSDRLAGLSGRPRASGASAGGQDGVVRLASLSPSSPRSTLLAAGAGADPLDAISTGVHTTAKNARVATDDAMLSPSADVIPAVERHISGRVLSGRRVVETIVASRRPKGYDTAMLTAPTIVYAAGFEQRPHAAQLDAFSGPAVRFLSVAKFAALD
jgi:uncharacterized protein YcbK (DUF882 family)